MNNPERGREGTQRASASYGTTSYGMRNPLTFNVESWVGSVLVLAFSAFMLGIFFIAVKNFGSDADVLAASDSGLKLKTVSAEEKALIDGWVKKTNNSLSVEDVGYRYIIKQYPDKPWTDR